MSRQSRLIVPGLPHHIIQRGLNRQAVFEADEDCAAYLDWLREAAKATRVQVHAYVLMPNHVHILATPQDETGLARMMQRVGRFYVPFFNRRHERSGTLWEGRFRTSVVDADHYLLACMRYIELNPVRAGLVSAQAEYVWSSYAHHAGMRADPLITDHPLYWALGNTPFQREAAYQALFEDAVAPEQTRQITDSAIKGLPLGSAPFLQQLAQKTKRAVLPGRRGRPFKTAAPA
ncbi:transposase [Massilia sp. TS11]|uniref:transposase n=1 Tax=Massilia sp. TS11 TaxID=2908003 RepID=UPI001EDBF812|nr:transposase [Massilia sp. TS11]MCG2585125.1 transposase [Massilia sp. TS11]